MFKQGKGKLPHHTQGSSDEQVYLTKDLLEFWARQINILKDIAQYCLTHHPDVVCGRLKQSINLLEKKLHFALGGNPQQYHDYIQDFYDSQLERLRDQLSSSKIAFGVKDRELQDVKANLNMLSLQMEGEREKSTYELENFEAISKLRKQLEHCQLLLKQNNSFIQEQASTIDELTKQVQQLNINNNSYRKNYELKALKFDEQINEYRRKFDLATKRLDTSQKQCQEQLKETALVKVKLTEAKDILSRELDMKTQQTRLLTKKIYEQELFISKYEKQITIKQRVTEQLYAQVEEYNTYKSQEISREQHLSQLISQQKSEIDQLNANNSQLTLKNQTNAKQLNQLKKQTIKFNKQKRQSFLKLEELEQTNQKNQKIIEQLEKQKKQQQKISHKITKQKQKLTAQLKLVQLRNSQLFQQYCRQKDGIKRGVMNQVNELVKISQQQEKNIKQLNKQIFSKQEQLTKERDQKIILEQRFDKINEIQQELQKKLQKLTKENKQIGESKVIVEEELQKILHKTQTLKQQFQQTIRRKQEKQSELNQLKDKHEKQIEELKGEVEGLKDTKSMEMSKVSKNDDEGNQKDAQVSILRNQLSNKDFVIRQLENKVKILQEEIKENNKCYQFEKQKMKTKIKELEELLSVGFPENSSR